MGGGFGGGGLDGDFNGFCRGSMVIMERVSDCCGGGGEVAEIAGWVHFLNLERKKEGRKEGRKDGQGMSDESEILYRRFWKILQ